MRRYLAASVACSAANAAATLGSAVLLAGIVAGVITDPATRSVAHWSDRLWMLLGLWAIRVVAQWAQGRLSQHGATAAIAELSGHVLRTVTAAAPRRLGAVRDDAAAVCTRGLDGLRPYFTGYLPTLFAAGILTPAALAVIAWVDLPSAVTIVIVLPLIPVFMVLIGLATRDRSAAALRAMTTLQARLADLIAGIPTLRAFGRIGGSARRLAEIEAAHRRSTMATLRIAFLSALVLELLATLSVALVAVGIGMRLVYGHMTLTAGLTALLLAPEVFWPLRRVGAEFHAAQDGRAAAEKALELLNTPTAAGGGTRRVAAAGRTITVAGLSGPVEPGRVTVLTGPNGCGKSTALQRILGLEPGPSRVRVGDVDLDEIDRADWWAQVAWLPHRPVLVPGTVRENLELFGPLPDLERACRDAAFDEVLAELPDGPDTRIGRGGVGLSLGQRQRLGLARVLGSAAPVLLLDEPTAHLDAACERRVLDAIVARSRCGTTVLMVGHRDAVLAAADRVVRLERVVQGAAVPG